MEDFMFTLTDVNRRVLEREIGDHCRVLTMGYVDLYQYNSRGYCDGTFTNCMAVFVKNKVRKKYIVQVIDFISARCVDSKEISRHLVYERSNTNPSCHSIAVEGDYGYSGIHFTDHFKADEFFNAVQVIIQRGKNKNPSVTSPVKSPVKKTNEMKFKTSNISSSVKKAIKPTTNNTTSATRGKNNILEEFSPPTIEEIIQARKLSDDLKVTQSGIVRKQHNVRKENSICFGRRTKPQQTENAPVLRETTDQESNNVPPLLMPKPKLTSSSFMNGAKPQNQLVNGRNINNPSKMQVNNIDHDLPSSPCFGPDVLSNVEDPSNRYSNSSFSSGSMSSCLSPISDEKNVFECPSKNSNKPPPPPPFPELSQYTNAKLENSKIHSESARNEDKANRSASSSSSCNPVLMNSNSLLAELSTFKLKATKKTEKKGVSSPTDALLNNVLKHREQRFQDSDSDSDEWIY